MVSYGATLLLATILAAGSGGEPAHARNDVYTRVIQQGIEYDGARVTLPAPRISDGQTADQQREALVAIAGSERGADEMLRDSVTAPHILKVRDVKGNDGTIRVADVWFVVHADLSAVDPKQAAERATAGGEVEAGNMSFRTILLTQDQARAEGVDLGAKTEGVESWFAHVEGRMLDRIRIDVTNRVTATKSNESVVVASSTDPRFQKAGTLRNTWAAIAKSDGAAGNEKAVAYAGGISYGKISRLSVKQGALLVELHSAFIEPNGWFDGAPILRSKFSVVAQSEIRRLRRELQKKRGE